MAQDYNRIMSADDILKQTIEVRDERRDVPASDILTGTLLCLKFNEDWFPHIIGAVHTLQTFAAWIGDDDDSNTGSRQITKLLAQDMTDCAGDCPEELTIPEIISDDTYFVTEYVPVTFGEYYSETETYYDTQEAAHDDTPQSVAPLVPVAAPNVIQDNALCYAVNRFVELYASQKLCLIQSQNFIETLLSKMANAANNFYDAAANLMLPFYSPNIFSCFVSDAAAMTALQDDAAIEELACYLYDELKTVAMSQSNFDAAILDAATTLTGNAQDIACLINNDNSERVYISFLQGYNIALQRQTDGDELDCPCEPSDAYWMWIFDFSTGEHGWYPWVSGGVILAQYSGSYWENTSASATCSILKWFDSAYVIRAIGIEKTVVGYTGVAGDAVGMNGLAGAYATGATRPNGNTSGITAAEDGFFTREYRDLTESLTSQSYWVRLDNAGAASGSNYTRINRLVLYGLPDAGGAKPPGSVWVSGVPTSPDPLFPA